MLHPIRHPILRCGYPKRRGNPKPESGEAQTRVARAEIERQRISLSSFSFRVSASRPQMELAPYYILKAIGRARVSCFRRLRARNPKPESGEAQTRIARAEIERQRISLSS